MEVLFTHASAVCYLLVLLIIIQEYTLKKQFDHSLFKVRLNGPCSYLIKKATFLSFVGGLDYC